ncbi:MAG: hypothetical protein ACM3RP_03145 [Chitinophagales bacterium]
MALQAGEGDVDETAPGSLIDAGAESPQREPVGEDRLGHARRPLFGDEQVGAVEPGEVRPDRLQQAPPGTKPSPGK